MLRRSIILFVIFTALIPFAAARAQGPDGFPNYALNMRAGPGPGQPVITTIPAGTELIFEARSADMSWLLGHTTDGAYRGWLAALYLGYRDGFAAASLPVSDEVIPVVAVPELPMSAASASSFDSRLTAQLESMPVVPAIGPRVAEIFARGQTLGNNPHVFAKMGDCNTESLAFMSFFGTGDYTLGPYSYLQPTIDFFSVSPAPGIANSFVNQSAAAHTGFTSPSVLDPAWSDPVRCPAGVSPLDCEYDRIRPSVVLIMFGLADIHWIGPAEYEQALRQIVETSIDRGVIPVLTTFPSWSGENDGPVLVKRLQFNGIVINLAQEYGVPLMNFWRAAQPLPICGLEGDLLHLSFSGAESILLTGDEQTWGFTMWNLIALQTLDALRVHVLDR